MRSRLYIAVLAGFTLLAVAIWLLGMVYWESASSSARDIRLVDPPATEMLRVAPDGHVALVGRNAKLCEADDSDRIAATGDFELSTQPRVPSFGERIVWTKFECPDGSSTRFARVVAFDTRSVEGDEHVEVARVGINFRPLEDWLEAEFSGSVPQLIKESVEYNGLDSEGNDCPRLPERNENFFFSLLPVFEDDKCGVKIGGRIIGLDRYVVVDEVGDLHAFNFNVSNGFGIEVDQWLKIRTRTTNCIARTCGQDDLTWILFRLSFTAKMEATRNEGEAIIRLIVKGEEFDPDSGNWIRDAIIKLLAKNRVLEKLEELLEKKGNAHVGSAVMGLRNRIPEQVLTYLTSNDNESVKRIWNEMGGPDLLGLARVVVSRQGEIINFSLTVPDEWLGVGVAAPELEMDGAGEQLSLSVSYLLINKMLSEFLDNQLLSVVIGKLRTMLHLAGVVESDAFDDKVEEATTKLANQLAPYLKFSELCFDQSLNFTLPVRVRPASDQEMRMFFAHAKVLSTLSTDCRMTVPASDTVPIGLSVESRVPFDRTADQLDIDFLLDHFAFEPLGADLGRGVEMYYGLTPLFRKLIDWDRAGRLNGEEFGKVVAELRSFLLQIVQPPSFLLKEKMPVEVEVDLGIPSLDGNATTVASIDLVGNDMEHHAFLIRGKIGYSRAGAVFVTPDFGDWGVTDNYPTAKDAISRAQFLCEDEGESCSKRLVFYRASVAAAWSWSETDNGWYRRRYYFSKGANRELAEENARAQCFRLGGTDCTVQEGHTWSNESIQ